MTKEETELLVKDLSARIAYGVMLKTPSGNGYLSDIHHTISDWRIGVEVTTTKRCVYSIDEVKPYLRSFDSIEMEESDRIEEMVFPMETWDGEMPAVVKVYDAPKLLDYYDRIMVDYRDLIEKGLAIEAPEGMYDLMLKNNQL